MTNDELDLDAMEAKCLGLTAKDGLRLIAEIRKLRDITGYEVAAKWRDKCNEFEAEVRKLRTEITEQGVKLYNEKLRISIAFDLLTIEKKEVIKQRDFFKEKVKGLQKALGDIENSEQWTNYYAELQDLKNSNAELRDIGRIMLDRLEMTEGEFNDKYCPDGLCSAFIEETRKLAREALGEKTNEN